MLTIKILFTINSILKNTIYNCLAVLYLATIITIVIIVMFIIIIIIITMMMMMMVIYLCI